MKIVIISFIALLILIYELPPLIRQGWWKETAAFLVLLGLGVFLAIAQALDIKVPNPVDALEYIFTPVSTWVETMLS